MLLSRLTLFPSQFYFLVQQRLLVGFPVFVAFSADLSIVQLEEHVGGSIRQSRI